MNNLLPAQPVINNIPVTPQAPVAPTSVPIQPTSQVPVSPVPVTPTAPNNNLTPTLTLSQLKQNIDALQSKGAQTSDIQSYVNNYQVSPTGGYTLKGYKAPTSASTSQPSDFLHPIDSLSQQLSGAYNTAKQGITDAGGDFNKGGLGNVLKGLASGTLGLGSAAVQALFSPVSAVANTIIPGDNNLGSDTAKGAVAGAAIGSILPGPGTLAGAGIGALFGGGMDIVNHVKDAILNNTNASPEDKALVNNALNVGLAVLGAKAGGADLADLNPSDIVDNVKANLSDVTCRSQRAIN